MPCWNPDSCAPLAARTATHPVENDLDDFNQPSPYRGSIGLTMKAAPRAMHACVRDAASVDTSFSALAVSCLKGATKPAQGPTGNCGPNAVRLLEDACWGVEPLHAGRAAASLPNWETCSRPTRRCRREHNTDGSAGERIDELADRRW
jgi:hypothetical protein